MRNRWFHRPKLHSPPPGAEKKASWLELFYDLIFVAAFIQLGNGLSKHVSIEGFIVFAFVFIPLWVAWSGFTFYMNRFNVDDFTHRILVFIQMLAVGTMAISAPDIFDGDHRVFALSYAVAQAMIAIMYARTWKQVQDGRGYSRHWGCVFAIGAVIWFTSIFAPWPWMYLMWLVGVSVIFITPLSKQSRSLALEFPGDSEHLSERYGLLTIIVLGESFVKVLAGLSAEGAQLSILLQAGLLLLLTCCIWWIYFDDVAGSHIRGRGFTPIIWLYAHLPLHIAITGTGVAIKKAVLFDLSAAAPAPQRWLLAGTLALVFFSVALIDSVTERRQAELSDKARVQVRGFSALLILLLAPAGATMSAQLFLILITVVCAAQVIFDMMMAPFEVDPALQRVETTDSLHREATAPIDSPTRSRFGTRLGEAVRKGTPNELRRDLYFYFMDGSWTRFLLVLGFLYLIVNVFFAALYILEPGCIANSRPDSFADAFIFSVETMSTIGYGHFSPATQYAYILVTIEAAIGLLGVALATGLVFAKVSRPRAKVLFSKPMVVTKHDGVPTLIFRAGNAMGNEIVDASMTLTLVREETSPEGFQMMKMHDLKLTRSFSPMFVLSWIVMHPIDAESPLYGIDWEYPEEIEAIVATMVGHDGTYGQTVYARHSYNLEDIRPGHQFVDFTSEMDDGRMLLDYSKFHLTRAEDQGA